jgi:hypothetical protein
VSGLGQAHTLAQRLRVNAEVVPEVRDLLLALQRDPERRHALEPTIHELPGAGPRVVGP